jgi:predicted nucleic acid-binding Zn ribbon protein
MTDRGGEPSPLSDVLKSLLSRGKLGARVEQTAVLAAWPSIVGAQIAAVTEARAVAEDGTLFVHVRTHSWMTELSLREPEILVAIHAQLPELDITRIRFLAWRS